MPLVRATVGGGVFRGGRMAPVGVATVGTGTRGRRVRFYLEGEAALTRVTGRERRERIRDEPTGGRTSLGVTMTPVVFRPVLFALQAGVERPSHG